MQATPSPTASPPRSDLGKGKGKMEDHVVAANEGTSQAFSTQTTYPPAPVNVKSPPFSVLARLYDSLANERKPDKRRKALAGWFSHWRKEVGNDLYPVLRLLLPQKDRERAVYGLKEKNLAKTYIKLIPLGMKDPDSIRLLNWKRPTEKNKAAGDFPTVLFEVVSKRSSVVEGSLSIDDVNHILDEISKDMGKQDVQANLLKRIYNNATADEQRWIARIILKDMQISVKESTVFAIFHPDAHDLFNTCSDLKKVAWELADPNRRLNEEDKAVQLFRAFTPMLCKRPGPKLEETIKDMEGRQFIIEEKLDGERMQLHKRGNEYFYCSRKGKDYTYLYGSHIGTGSLTPHIDLAFDERIEEIILDGEMLVWDPVSQRNLPFGTLKTAARENSKRKLDPRPCFKIFDILYLNGQCLARRSLKFRKRNLKAYVKEIKGRLEYVAEYEGKTVYDVRKRLDDVMENRGEGLILKHPGSEYVLNGRTKDWVKVKPEYMDNMGETVDVLVIGGNYGTGYRSGGVSTLICAVLDDRRNMNNDDELKYSSFVRIGTGLSFADYVWIRQKNWKPFDKNNVPSWYQVSKKGTDDKGDIYLEPEDSFILRVKAAEITPSEQYHLGFTMRFPRALSIRDDLSIADCMTASDDPELAVLESLRNERKRKMEETKEEKTKKKRKVPSKQITVMPQYQGAKLKEVQIESDLFKDLTFMVASDPKSRTGEEEKKELQKICHANGGKVVQIAKGVDSILIVYGGSSIPYDLKLYIDRDIHDIIRPSWVYDCIDRAERVPLRKKYFFHATSERKLDREYNLEEEDGGLAKTTSNQRNLDVTPEEREDTHETDEEVKTTIDDPALSDWFKVDKMVDEQAERALKDEADSDTDPDSDYEEIRFEDEIADEWTPSQASTIDEVDKSKADEEVNQSEDVIMGEDENAKEYDQENIFRHLCFYLDTPDNAEKLGMPVKTKYKDSISTAFAGVEDAIIANGGRVVDLANPKLTHVVLDKRDTSRRKELIKLTSKPKRRNLVISDYIQACLDEDTLLDEEGFAP